VLRVVRLAGHGERPAVDLRVPAPDQRAERVRIARLHPRQQLGVGPTFRIPRDQPTFPARTRTHRRRGSPGRAPSVPHPPPSRNRYDPWTTAAPAAFTARRARPAAPQTPGLALPARRPHSSPEAPPATGPRGSAAHVTHSICMDDPAPDTWNVTPAEAREIQLRLRERIITHPPPGFAPRLIAGADL